jgi:16S rRNA (cytosine967-C5)-methyltransferase
VSRTPRAPVDAARRIAAEVVLKVDVDGAYSNLLLPRLLRERGLTGRDAAFTTEVAYGTLRWQGVLDDILAAASGRPVDGMDAPVRAVLRIGAYQLLRMQTPAHAAVHATVDVARELCGHRPVSLVNAVLRKVSAADFDEWQRRLAPGDDAAALAFRHGHPRWIVTAIADALGGDTAELALALAEDRPVTHLVARPGRISRDALLRAAGPDARPGPWSPYAVRLAGGDPAALAPVARREAGVQDEGSQLVALAAAQAPVTDDRGRWLDTCAGPGGKAALLEALLPAGGRLVAADRQPHRARLVSSVTGSATGVVVADGTRPSWRPDEFDRVLVDAPCSGLGALRRRPEVRWRRRADDVPRLARLQVELLLAAVDAARPGGVVCYATCSPHPAETRDVVAAARAQRPHLEPVDVTTALPDVPGTGPGPDAQLWPHRHGTDAMYIALLRKSAGP